ncbi:MAG: hypothetical protein NVS9B1_26310 [Candidatus Dormibacteraceae bacterium]
MSMKSLAIALFVLVGVLGGFYGGYHSGLDAGARSAAVATPSSRAITAPAATGFGVGSGGFAGGGGRGNAGTVTGLTATGFTLHSANGTDVKVAFGTGVTVRKTADGSIADLKENSTVTVAGQRGADGTIAATAVTIVPAGTGQPGG